MCLSIDFRSLLKILKSWDDVKPRNLFILVFVVLLQTSTVILCEKVPQQCTAWIITCPIHCELMVGKKDQPIILVLLNLEFPDVDVFLLFHVWMVVIEAQHAFH